MASGIMAELATPVRKRARVSRSSDVESALRTQHNAAPVQAIATTGILPYRSPKGPCTSTKTPLANRNAVATIEAAPTVTPNSAPSWTSSGSVTRMLAAEAKAATDRNTIASTGAGRGEPAGGDIAGALPGRLPKGKVVRP